MEGIVHQKIKGLLMLSGLIEQGDIGKHERVAVGQQILLLFKQGEPFLHGPSEARQELFLLEEEAAVPALKAAGSGNFTLCKASVAVIVVGNGQVPVGRGQRGQQRNRGLPVTDGSGVLLFVVEQFTEVIMRFCRFGQDGNSVIQDQLFHDAAWEAQIRGEGFGFPDTGEGGCCMPLLSLGVGQRIGDHGMRNRTGGEHMAGILPEPEAKELIGGGQVILHAAAGSPCKIISAVFPEEEREIQRINLQALLKELLIFRAVCMQCAEDACLE